MHRALVCLAAAAGALTACSTSSGTASSTAAPTNRSPTLTTIPASATTRPSSTTRRPPVTTRVPATARPTTSTTVPRPPADTRLTYVPSAVLTFDGGSYRLETGEPIPSSRDEPDITVSEFDDVDCSYENRSAAGVLTCTLDAPLDWWTCAPTSPATWECAMYYTPAVWEELRLELHYEDTGGTLRGTYACERADKPDPRYCWAVAGRNVEWSTRPEAPKWQVVSEPGAAVTIRRA